LLSVRSEFIWEGLCYLYYLKELIMNPINRLLNKLLVVFALCCALLAGCASTGSTVRSYVDERTAVSVTAQKHAMVFYHEDFQAGVNIYDFADLGAFEVNQSGKRHQYLCLVLWSTLARTPEHQSAVEDAFANLVVWADDQPITFKRVTQNREMLLLGDEVFKRSTANVREAYYAVTPAQLSTLAAAKQLKIEPADQAQGETPYRPWRNEHNGLTAFAEEIANTAKMMGQ
jgi:hypothetical protein